MRARNLFTGLKLFQQPKVGFSTSAPVTTFHEYKERLIKAFSNAGFHGFGPVFHVDPRRDAWIAAAKKCNSFEDLIAKSQGGELPKLNLPKHVEAQTNKNSCKI